MNHRYYTDEYCKLKSYIFLFYVFNSLVIRFHRKAIVLRIVSAYFKETLAYQVKKKLDLINVPPEAEGWPH